MAEVNQDHVMRAVYEGNGKVVINDALMLDIVIGDNIMIIEDQYRSGYECRECNGAGIKEINCLKCDGTGQTHDYGPNPNDAENPLITNIQECGRCDGKGFRTESCKACNGKGALLEIPENARARPTSGTIAAKGPDVKVYELGDRVAYSGHTGHLLPFKGNNRLRIMREREPFCRLRNVVGQDLAATNIEFIDKDNPYDLQ